MTEPKSPSTVPEQDKLIQLTPGVMLRDAREASGQTHAAVGEALHLTVHYIKALENDDYSKLPGLIFVKGYIRSYGHHLKMDVDALIRSYDSHVGVVTQIATQSMSNAERRQLNRRRNDQSYGWALVAGLIVVIALGAGWWFVGRDQSTASTDVSQSAASAANATTSVSTTAPATANSSQASRPVGGTPMGSNSTQSGQRAMYAAMSPAQASTSTAPVSASVTAPGTAAFNNMIINSAGDADASASTPQDSSSRELALPTADVTSAATAIAPTGEVIESGEATVPPVLQTTVAEDGVTIIPAADGTRQVSMFRTGNDELQLRFGGDSWVEIDDGSNMRLYSDMLSAGDTLTIQGTAPFQVLLGNARNVAVSFNSSTVDISPSIRGDNTARVRLSNPGTAAPVQGTGVAQ